MKHFSFNTSERENRNVNNRDDRNAEEHGSTDLFARGEHGVEAFFSCQWAPKMVLTNSQLTHDILHNHNCAIYDQTEIDRAKTHQISRDAELQHASHREQKRKRNRGGHNKRGAPVAE